MIRALALLLAALTVGGAVWVVLVGDRTPDVSAAERRVHVLSAALLRLQGADGAFDPYADDTGTPPPEVLRTVPHALATAALARAHGLGAAPHVPGLKRGRDAALDVLVARQGPGGSFGGLPPAAQNPWPGVEATAGAILAFGLARRPEDRPILQAALGSFERTTRYGLREGRTRALAAVALETAAAGGGGALLGQDPRLLLRLAPGPLDPACTDAALAEAILRRVVGAGEADTAAVAGRCAAETPAWQGERTDVAGWWMRAWLAARTGEDGLLTGLGMALDAALEADPAGRIPGGWYADEITQTAAALLAAAEVVAPLALPAHPAPVGDASR